MDKLILDLSPLTRRLDAVETTLRSVSERLDELAPGGAASLLRVREVADRLSVNPNRVYEMVNAGRLPAVRIGRSMRVPEEAVVSFVDGLQRDDNAATASQ